MDDLQAYLDRVIEIANDLDEIALADQDYPDERNVRLLEVLPFVFVEDGEATYDDSINATTARVTREIISLIYVQPFTPENAQQENEARRAARILLPIYARQFLRRNRLQINGKAMPWLHSARLAADSGIQTASRNQVVYACLYFRHGIVYDEAINQA